MKRIYWKEKRRNENNAFSLFTFNFLRIEYIDKTPKNMKIIWNNGAKSIDLLKI